MVDQEKPEGEVAAPAETKKPYDTPVLKKHGEVRQVTFSSHGGSNPQSGPDQWQQWSEERRGDLSQKSQSYAASEAGANGPLPGSAPEATPEERDPYRAFREGTVPAKSLSDEDNAMVARRRSRARQGSTG
jgi:hypothetical protein